MHTLSRAILAAIIAFTFLVLLLAMAAPAYAQTASCPASRAYPTWTEGANKCTTWHKYASSGRLVHLRHGERWYYRQQVGLMRGTLTQRCSNGVRVTIGSTCRPATHCDARWTVNVGGVNYTYTAWGTGRVLPGVVVQGKAQDGRTTPMICGPDFRMRAAPEKKAKP